MISSDFAAASSMGHVHSTPWPPFVHCLELHHHPSSEFRDRPFVKMEVPTRDSPVAVENPLGIV